MPWKSAQQELYFWVNMPELAKAWYRRYGHAPGFKEALKRIRRRKSYGKKKAK